MKERGLNYKIMLKNSQEIFLKFDQEKMIEKFHLNHNQQEIEITLLGESYFINRKNGKITYLESSLTKEADYVVAMSIFDILCYSEEVPKLSGEWSSISSLGSVLIGAGHSESGLLNRHVIFFRGKVEKLKIACEKLGGIQSKPGDVSYRMPMFSFFPVWFQFWDEDEEFSAKIQCLWDSNAMKFVHYETLWYMMNHLLERITEELEKQEIEDGD